MTIVLHPARTFFGLVLSAIAAIAFAQAPAPLVTPDLSTLAFSAQGGGTLDPSQVHIIGSDPSGRLFIGGSFNAVNGQAYVGMARLNVDGTLDTTWLVPTFTGIGRVAQGDAGGGVSVAFDNAGTYTVWRVTPAGGGSGSALLYTAPAGKLISRIASDPASNIYVAEEAQPTFSSTSSATVYRLDPNNVAAPVTLLTVSGRNGCESAAADPFSNQSRVYALVHDGAGALYVAGDYTSLSSGASGHGPIGGIVRLATPNGAIDTSWLPLGGSLAAPPPVTAPGDAKLTCIPSPSRIVRGAAIPGDGYVYLGGFFAAQGVSSLARFDPATGAADLQWNPFQFNNVTRSANSPGLDSPRVLAIASDIARHRIYASGPIASGGVQQLLAFVTLPGAVLDTAWNPSPNATTLDAGVNSLVMATGRVDVGGDFTDFAAGPTSRINLAAFAPAGVSFVDLYYQSLLGRAADSPGVRFWIGEANRVASLGIDAREVYIAMGIAFLASPEFQALMLTNAQFVDKMYAAFLNRPADSDGSAFWVSQLDAGMTRDLLSLNLLFSTEFNTLMARNLPGFPMLPDVGMVVDFYRGAFGRLPDSAGLNFWVSRMRRVKCNGGDVKQVAIDISTAFFQSAEYTQRPNGNADYISDLYNAFLRRGGDAEGFNYWVNQLATGGAARDAVRQAFVDSPEFANRLQAVAAEPCFVPPPRAR